MRIFNAGISMLEAEVYSCQIVTAKTNLSNTGSYVHLDVYISRYGIYRHCSCSAPEILTENRCCPFACTSSVRCKVMHTVMIASEQVEQAVRKRSIAFHCLSLSGLLLAKPYS